jgi:hypothetical protein
MENRIMTQFLSNFDQKFTPSQEFTDPVGKFRVSQPVALIDTDFEYGTQGTKWESLSMTNNRPFAFSSAIPLKNIADMTMPLDSNIVTVDLTTKTATVSAIATSQPAAGYVTYTTSTDHNFVIGEYVNISDVTAAYNGLYQIVEVGSATTFSVANAATSPAGDQNGTAISGYAPPNGSIITVIDTLVKPADGTYLIESGGGTAQFSYYATAQNTTEITDIVDTTKTSIFSATSYVSAPIGGAPTVTNTGKAVSVVTTVPHGLSIGNEIALTGTTASTNPPNGSWTVATVLSPTQIIFYADDAPSGTIGGTARLFVRPQGTFAHRPFDGGVIFSTNGNSNNQQAIRQTRRYFRYQSGKGLQYSSGSLMRPSFQLDELSCDNINAIITIQTKEQHNLIPGAEINIINATTTGYNRAYTVKSVLTYNRFTVDAPIVLPAKATGRYYMTVSGWTGSVVRAGLFDEQNGIFFEFDGDTLYAVQRNSTYQVSGRVSVTQGGNTVTQTGPDFPTSFTSQLDPGDYVVIRGQSYKILSIESDTSLTISPSYRGATTTYVTMSKTFDKKIPQSSWNLDKADGTGFTGYELDLNRMQMFYIDYSWYGAGAIRWGFRATDGEITYVHKEVNNNVNLEAYMRSGNLPARYETNTVPVYTKTTSTLSSSATSLSVASTASFNDSGTITVRTGTKVETMNYSSKNATTFQGLTRAKTGNSSVNLTIATGSSKGTVVTVGDLANVQIGQRVISPSFPTATFVTDITGSQITFSKAATTANPTAVIFAPMSSVEQTFTYSDTAPVIVENAFPEFSPTVSHWGTSVIMDGGYDDDKSLVFTYGQKSSVSIAAGETRSLFAIRIAPSVDNGIVSEFGGREIVNRMQLILRSLDVSARATGNFLVRAVLNGIPAAGTQEWTDAIGGVGAQANSSLAQIADFSARDIPIFGGEVVAGYYVSGTGSLDLSLVRELGNSVLGGGSKRINEQIYPDGPDVLTIIVTNVATSGTGNILGRISWTEAQA